MRVRLWSVLLAGGMLAAVLGGVDAAEEEPSASPLPPTVAGPPLPVADWLRAQVAPSPRPAVEPEPEAVPESERPRAAAVVRRGRPSTGAVALTFDDGYNSRACSLIADQLRRHDAVGTFFINGQWLQRAPVTWRRILEGMEVGNHTRSHPDLTHQPHPVVINQVRSNEDIHEQVLGRPMLKVFRPPYGAHSERTDRIAGQLGYEYVALWNVDSEDWRREATPASIVRRAVGAAPGSIILMHCARSATVKALPHVIRHYQRRGIELAGLSTVLEGAVTTRGGDARAQRYDQP